MKRQEITDLLQVKGKEQKDLFALARNKREDYFGNKAFMRAVVEISNYCRNNCDYCGMRRENKELNRYRLPSNEIIEIAQQIKEIGINTLFLQSGEEPKITEVAKKVLLKAKDLDLTTILCLGNKTKKEYKRLKEAGADKYILKHETSDSKLHYLTRHQYLKDRLQCLEWLLELEYKVGTGTIVGLPRQSIDNIADDILLAKNYNVDMVSASPFIPNDKTPFKGKPYGNLDLTLNTMAVMRLILPHALIPTVSALERLQKYGQLKGFNAGANVITINMTPPHYRKNYIIYTTDRNIIDITHAKNTIKKAGLEKYDLKE